MTRLYGLSMRANSPAYPARGWVENTGLSCPEDECLHGRLPTDGTVSCGCWGELEQPVQLQLVVEAERVLEAAA